MNHENIEIVFQLIKHRYRSEGRRQESYGVFWGLSDTIGANFLCVLTDYEFCNRSLGKFCVCIDLTIDYVTYEWENFIAFVLPLDSEIYTLFEKK